MTMRSFGIGMASLALLATGVTAMLATWDHDATGGPRPLVRLSTEAMSKIRGRSPNYRGVKGSDYCGSANLATGEQPAYACAGEGNHCVNCNGTDIVALSGVLVVAPYTTNFAQPDGGTSTTCTGKKAVGTCTKDADNNY